MGVADAGVATQDVVVIRTATALPETEKRETDPTRMVDYCRQALALWTDNQSPTCL